MNHQLQRVQHLPPLIADDPELEASFEQACDKVAKVKQYSAEQLHRRDPAKYRLIVRMIGESLSTRMISRACGISAHTVEAVRIREGYSIAKERARLLELVRSASRLCVERLLELIPEMSARDAAIAAGITIDKALLLQGEPTVVIESTVNHILHSNFNALLDAIDVTRVASDPVGEVEDKR
jgi:hypothetical protein